MWWGDIPVHVGDYVTPAAVPSTVLTTVDETSGLEAYVYIPTDRASLVKLGLPVDILDTDGKVLTKSTISFLSPEVDNGIQGILAKAEIPSDSHLRTQQVVSARVTWNSSPKPTVPVLAVQQIGGQSFVFVAKAGGQGAGGQGYSAHLVPVSLGEAIGNNYPITGGLKPGDQVIVSGPAVYRRRCAGEADDGTARACFLKTRARTSRRCLRDDNKRTRARAWLNFFYAVRYLRLSARC